MEWKGQMMLEGREDKCYKNSKIFEQLIRMRE